MMISAIDTGPVFQVIWMSALFGTVFSILLSLTILGSAQSAEARRAGRSREAFLYGLLGVVALALCLVGVILGVIAIT